MSDITFILIALAFMLSVITIMFYWIKTLEKHIVELNKWADWIDEQNEDTIVITFEDDL